MNDIHKLGNKQWLGFVCCLIILMFSLLYHIIWSYDFLNMLRVFLVVEKIAIGQISLISCEYLFLACLTVLPDFQFIK